MEEIKMNTLYTFLEPTNIDNILSRLEEIFCIPENPDDLGDPFIDKLIQQQEELNRFRDVCNPGISYGFYNYW
jgi:hypothetical protein